MPYRFLRRCCRRPPRRNGNGEEYSQFEKPRGVQHVLVGVTPLRDSCIFDASDRAQSADGDDRRRGAEGVLLPDVSLATLRMVRGAVEAAGKASCILQALGEEGLISAFVSRLLSPGV